MRQPELLLVSGAAVFHIAFIVVLFILTGLSRILGAALKSRPVYRLMYAAIACLIAALAAHLTGQGFRLYGLGLDIAGLALGCAVTWYYWKWLLKDLKRG